MQESQPQMLKFKKGVLDWVGLDRDNFTQMITVNDGVSKLNKEYQDRFVFYEESGLSASYLVFNLKSPIFKDNPDLRKAIAYAIDIQRSIDLLNSGRGHKLYTVVPPNIPGSEKNIGRFGYDYS